MVELFENSGDPDQAPHPDLGLYCLLVTLLGVSRWSEETICMKCILKSCFSKKKKKIQIIYNLCHVSHLDEPQVKHWHFKIILPD